ncbi:PREDICTED: uncharacterized protein LOC105556248 isoform X2 [Vollenhovia emeryi]|uniref:uncharacterized protein LOC105556248 isoform X2 n=1 Tax=Vollenhovia emeryi TaxID=411798 RepID=UPI0005F50255|nr:PREDICTED: uncharacterized protein LOC105556248 isoform X2 [Vollenhovia emeryi]
MPRDKKYKPYRFTTSYYRNVKRNQESENTKIRILHTSHNVASTEEQIIMEPQDLDIHINDRNPLTREEMFESNLIPELDEFDRNEEKILKDKVTLLTDLQHWAMSHKLTLASITGLLKILRSHGMTELPKDGRALLKTPSITKITEMGGGKFWYNGIRNNLLSALSNCDIQQQRTIKLLFNIDGMSPFNSSLYQFWPISFIVEDMPQLQVMVAAVYYGESKPPLQLYLKQFVHELNEILRDGLIINMQKITVGVKCFVCDTQARSYIKGTPACNAENGSCIKCTVVGTWDKKGRHMSYPRFDCPRRTDESFRNKMDEDHHKENTPLIDLPIDMVEDFVVADSLHLFDLGIMRRCLYGWREGSYNFRTKLSKTQADEMSQMLKTCNDTKPMDFQRSIRTLNCLKFWKDDVRKFGSLPEISSYPFENHLGHIKTLIRSGNLPLSQISRRILELSALNHSKSTGNSCIYVENEIFNQVHDIPTCRNAYKRLHLTDNFILSSDNKNRYFLTNNGQVVSMINATYVEDKIYVYGANLKSKYNFFVKPFASSRLNIFASKGIIDKNSEGHAIYICDFSNPILYSLSDIKCKLFCLPYHNEFIFIPLLHTLDIKHKL